MMDQRIITIVLVILLYLGNNPTHLTEAAQARRAHSSSSTISSDFKYDKRITDIDPSGRILQVEYAMEAAHRRSLTSASALLTEHNVGIMVYISNHNDGGRGERRKLHRIDSGTICVSSGLDGDGRMLVNYLRQISCEECRLDGDLLSVSANSRGADVQVLARACGNVQHRLTITPGQRPLGAAITLMGLLSSRSPSCLGLFQCEAGGIVESCECTASGIGRERVKVDLVELLRDFKKRTGKDSALLHDVTNNDRNLEQGVDDKSLTEIIPDFIKRTTRVVFKRYLERQQQHSTKEKDEEKVPAVDIYFVKPDSKCRGGVQITCALNVKEHNLDHVANLFAADEGDEDSDLMGLQ